MVNKSLHSQRGMGTAAFTILALVVIATAVFWYLRWTDSRQPRTLELSADAKQYVQFLKLNDVQLKAHESYMKQMVVEVVGSITNTGSRQLQVVELNCVFYDPYGQLVLRQRVPIVSSRMGGLKPGETKQFRLPFDDLPESWNNQLPQLVIAGILF